ncbi:MAG: hypothetical protein K0S08_702 [Gammaproteobacteria bacterium]|jgi:aromatase|nr:hypothetical protein [Gammaproteobacteria bacterium]
MSDIKGFKYGFEEEIAIKRPWLDVYSALHNLKAWPEYLPHVKKIDLIYDDGHYQEFRMHVTSTNGDILSVRSIRKCDQNSKEIQFFQPEPPEYLKHHCGGWRFVEKDGACHVTTYHKWNLKNEIAEDEFPSNEKESTAEQVEKILKNHAKLALSTWKVILEEGIL